MAHDITEAVERRKAYTEAWRREERLRAILASSPDAIVIFMEGYGKGTFLTNTSYCWECLK